MHHLVYLHGFLSSPQSVKAQQTLVYAQKHFPAINVHVPQLPGDIHKSLSIIDALIHTLPLSQTCFIGSSMGGFLASYCIEKSMQIKQNAKHKLASAPYLKADRYPKGVLINPAVEPFKLLKEYLGRHTNPYTNEVFYVWPQHIQILASLYAKHLVDPKRYKVLLQMGDETLDYRIAAKKYAASELLVETAGNHSFVDYEKHLPSIFNFLFTPR